MSMVEELTREELEIVSQRKREILARYETSIASNIEACLQDNGAMQALYQRAQDENRRMSATPAVVATLDNYAAGQIERLYERLYANQANPQFIAFLEKQGRFPRNGDLYRDSPE